MYLVARGFAYGERGAVFAPNRVEWISAALGIQSAGGVMVPIYAASTVEQLRYVVNHAQDRIIFTDLSFLPTVKSLLSEMPSVEHVVVMTDRAHMAPYMAVRDRFVALPPPASTLMIVSGFTRSEFKVEVEAIAAQV